MMISTLSVKENRVSIFYYSNVQLSSTMVQNIFTKKTIGDSSQHPGILSQIDSSTWSEFNMNEFQVVTTAATAQVSRESAFMRLPPRLLAAFEGVSVCFSSGLC
jgi:hypothetical protein